MKLFCVILWGYENVKSSFDGVQTILLDKHFDEVIDQRLKEKKRYLAMINSLTSINENRVGQPGICS